MDEEKALIAVTRTLSTLTDGTVRLKIDFEPNDRTNAMQYFGEPQTPIAVAVLDKENVKEVNQKLIIKKGLYGQQAKILKQSSFFRTKVVWEKIGSDEEYLEWIRTLPCCVCKKEPAKAAHVRRIASGAGVGIKPTYSAVPLCRECHALQHHSGESKLNVDLDKIKIDLISTWSWVTLKKHFDKESWTEIDPMVLYAWAGCNDVLKYLPKDYYMGWTEGLKEEK